MRCWSFYSSKAQGIDGVSPLILKNCDFTLVFTSLCAL
jgi:hypothetical protein